MEVGKVRAGEVAAVPVTLSPFLRLPLMAVGVREKDMACGQFLAGAFPFGTCLRAIPLGIAQCRCYGDRVCPWCVDVNPSQTGFGLDWCAFKWALLASSREVSASGPGVDSTRCDHAANAPEVSRAT